MGGWGSEFLKGGNNLLKKTQICPTALTVAKKMHTYTIYCRLWVKGLLTPGSSTSFSVLIHSWVTKCPLKSVYFSKRRPTVFGGLPMFLVGHYVYIARPKNGGKTCTGSHLGQRRLCNFMVICNR